MSERPNMSADKRTPPDDIELRVRPKPVRRINRKVLMGGTALLSIVLFAAVLVALDPPDFRGGQQVQELYNTDRKPVADGLAGLPSTYDATPKLGPPLPGDIGDALHKVDTNAPPELPMTNRFSQTRKLTLPAPTAFVWHVWPSRGGSRSCSIRLRRPTRSETQTRRKGQPHRRSHHPLRLLGSLMTCRGKDNRHSRRHKTRSSPS
jgi:hypothetical protein